ncbi:hypothetical protein D1007_41071 [Hordeum vulgare]|nr:hypothetical protein D1007_41071 [Hordeum vulgare]
MPPRSRPPLRRPVLDHHFAVPFPITTPPPCPRSPLPHVHPIAADDAAPFLITTLSPHSRSLRRHPVDDHPLPPESSQEDVDVKNAENNKDDSFYDNVNQEDIDDCIDDDGEVEIDIAETEKLEKMLDTHCKVMEMIFQSQGDAYMFYNNHAKERGFGIRKEKVKRGKGSAGIIRFRRFVCFRAGRRRENS